MDLNKMLYPSLSALFHWNHLSWSCFRTIEETPISWADRNSLSLLCSGKTILCWTCVIKWTYCDFRHWVVARQINKYYVNLTISDLLTVIVGEPKYWMFELRSHVRPNSCLMLNSKRWQLQTSQQIFKIEFCYQGLFQILWTASGCRV